MLAEFFPVASTLRRGPAFALAALYASTASNSAGFSLYVGFASPFELWTVSFSVFICFPPKLPFLWAFEGALDRLVRAIGGLVPFMLPSRARGRAERLDG